MICADFFLQNVVATFGRDAGIDANADPPVAVLLEDVRSRLSKFATVEWIDHSPRVVAGMEETLRKTAFDQKLISEFVRRIEEGRPMTQAEADKHFASAAGPDPHHVHSSPVTVSGHFADSPSRSYQFGGFCSVIFICPAHFACCRPESP